MNSHQIFQLQQHMKLLILIFLVFFSQGIFAGKMAGKGLDFLWLLLLMDCSWPQGNESPSERRSGPSASPSCSCCPGPSFSPSSHPDALQWLKLGCPCRTTTSLQCTGRKVMGFSHTTDWFYPNSPSDLWCAVQMVTGTEAFPP